MAARETARARVKGRPPLCVASNTIAIYIDGDFVSRKVRDSELTFSGSKTDQGKSRSYKDRARKLMQESSYVRPNVARR